MSDVFVRCGSHRARQRLKSLLGVLPKRHWSYDHPCTGGYYKIPEEKLEAARKIPGVTKTKFADEMRECW